MNDLNKLAPCSHEPVKRVGYAYVPVQRIEKVYQPCAALEYGTIFPELNIGLDEYQRGLWCGK